MADNSFIDEPPTPEAQGELPIDASVNPENPAQENQNPEGEAQPEAPKEPEPPEIIYGYVPSAFISETDNLRFIDFSSYPKVFYDELKQTSCDNVPNFQERPLMESFDKLLNEFEKSTISKIIKEPSDLIKDFTDYVKSQINADANKFLAVVWPPVLPNTEYKQIVYFMIRILHALKNPKPFLAWLSTSVYPRLFTREKQPELIAFAKCHYQKKNGYWATIDGSRVFHLYRYQSGDYVDDINGPAKSVSMGSDGSITVNGEEGILATFSPDDSSQAALWKTILTQPIHILNFFTQFNNPTIDQVYIALYNALTNADGLILKTLLQPDVCDLEKSDSMKMIKNMFSLMAYAQKTIPFYNIIINNDLGSLENDVSDAFSGLCYTTLMCQYVFDTYGGPYITNFITPLANYIDNFGKTGIETQDPNVPEVERLVSTIVKYIVESYALIPPQIQIILNIIRTALVCRTNTKSDIYRALSNIFFVQFICGIFMNISDYVPSVRHVEVFKNLGLLFETIFRMGQINGDFTCLEALTKRLERHIYPRLMEFIFSISDAPIVEPEYDVLDQKKLVRAIDDIAKIVANSEFINKFKNQSSADNKFLPSNIGTNFAGTLCNFFIHSDDVLEVAEERERSRGDGTKHHHKLVKLELSQDEDGKVVESKIKRDPDEIVDPSKPRKYYKRVVKKVPLA